MERKSIKLKRGLAALFLANAVIATPSLAQQGSAQTPEQRAARFDAMDTNKDGKLTKAEFVAGLPDQMKDRADVIWARMNPTGKDSITKEEFLAAPMGRPGGAPPTPQ